MKCNILFLIFVFIQISINAQSKIPEVIKSDMTIKALPKYYESTGFTVEKGVTLTIMAGTKIKITSVKDKDPIIRINGNLIIGAVGIGKNQTVIIDGNSPAIVFRNSTVDLNNLEINAPQVLFLDDSKGTINNCKFLTGPDGVWYKIQIDVSKLGKLVFKDTLFEDKGVEVNSTDFPNDLDKLDFDKCSFTTKYSVADKKNKLHLMTMTALAYGSKCDCHINIEFKQFDWKLTKPLSTEWYFSDEKARKSIGDSSKFLKTFDLKLPSKPFTSYKQEEAPTEKVEKK